MLSPRADAGLVEFLDHLLDWSADHPIFLLVLTRPEGADRSGLVLSRRNIATLSLGPLPDQAMGEVLDGLVTGLPTAARERIIERAEGIPFYAVETVRSLLDSGRLVEGGDGELRLVGELGTLEIPPGLKALIASRLDALTHEERQVVKECAVLGDSFPRQSIEAVTDAARPALAGILASLVHKEVLTVRAEKLSPEVPPFLRMQVRRAEALVSAARGRSDGVEEHLRAAEAAFGDLGYRYWHARIRLDLAEWLAHEGRADEATALANAAAITFEELGVEPMRARARSVPALLPTARYGT